MPRRKIDTKSRDLFNIQEHLATAPCVPAIRNAVKQWRAGGYIGVTDTTRDLLNYWFLTDHRLPDGSAFRYHNAQREAIETLIYLFEVEKVRTRTSLLEHYARQGQDLRLPPSDDFARYCIKMATGSGKTKVMALAIAWQYFNAVKENNPDYARNFLIIAPNVIVFERLKTDFESGRIFRNDPLFPRHYELFWDFESYMRGDPERSSSQGALYLTNIQQFYERGERENSAEPEQMTAVMGGKPPSEKMEITDFPDRIAKREGRLLVLNDEAHHTHEEDNEWNNVIHKLHHGLPLAAQMDFSATPRYSKGALFAWTVYDYPLKQAILDRIVKRPIKGISKITEARTTIASKKYLGFLTAGVERWKEYRETLKDLKKKPILFIMMNSTDEADDIGDWMRTKYPEDFGGERTLVIHTDKAGEVSKKELDVDRKVARDVDEEKSPVNAIVSVLMLREGWDVQNVTVVVGLRPYTAKANILPEQTIGRGLRLMFRNLMGTYEERVDIIGNKPFMEFVEDLEKLEDLKFDTFEIGKDKLSIITIKPEESKKHVDIGIPDITPLIGRKGSLDEEIQKLDLTKFKAGPLPLKGKDIEETKTFIYEGFDILTNHKLLEREYTIPPAQTAEEVIGYYARRITNDIKLPSQFALVVPKVREYFEKHAFGRTVDLSEPEVIRAMGSNIASYVVIREFEKALRSVIVEEKQPEMHVEKRYLSMTPPFPFSKVYFEAKKTIYNYVACDNEFERAFAKFLEQADDVKAFAKLPEQLGFCIQYTDLLANIRNYYPDFIVLADDNTHWLIETKGREDTDVINKDRAAKNWCKVVSEITGEKWEYMKVLQREFEGLHPDDLEDFIVASATNV